MWHMWFEHEADSMYMRKVRRERLGPIREKVTELICDHKLKTRLP